METLDGWVEVKTCRVETNLIRVAVRVLNRTPVTPALMTDPEAVLMRTMARRVTSPSFRWTACRHS